jgi:hypothetical protein
MSEVRCSWLGFPDLQKTHSAKWLCATQITCPRSGQSSADDHAGGQRMTPQQGVEFSAEIKLKKFHFARQKLSLTG